MPHLCVPHLIVTTRDVADFIPLAFKKETKEREPALLFLVVQPDSSNSSVASAEISKSDIEENGMKCNK